jgi:hypothetical protein
MDFGIGIASGVDGWRAAQRAEALGFTQAWFYDTQMLCADVFVSMALAAAQTPAALGAQCHSTLAGRRGGRRANALGGPRIARPPGWRSPDGAMIPRRKGSCSRERSR